MSALDELLLQLGNPDDAHALAAAIVAVHKMGPVPERAGAKAEEKARERAHERDLLTDQVASFPERLALIDAALQAVNALVAMQFRLGPCLTDAVSAQTDMYRCRHALVGGLEREARIAACPGHQWKPSTLPWTNCELCDEQGETPGQPSYRARVRALEVEGLTTSDAQAVADAEGLLEDDDDYPPPCTNRDGHDWVTSEETDRCYCAYCGADGDA